MHEKETRMSRSETLPKELEDFIPDMQSIHLLSIFFTKYGRIAYVSLYKQALSHMTQEQVMKLYQHEVSHENDIATRLGGTGPEMFERNLFNPEVSSQNILNKEGVYRSLNETRYKALHNPTLLSYMDKLTSLFDKLIIEEDFRQLRASTNKYRSYIYQILQRPEYRLESKKRAEAFLNRFRSKSDDSDPPSFSLS